MTLILICIAIAIDLAANNLERYRAFNWLYSFHDYLDTRFSSKGVVPIRYATLLLLLSVPLLILAIVISIASHISWILEATCILFVLVYCISTKEILKRLERYIISSENGENNDAIKQKMIHEELINKPHQEIDCMFDPNDTWPTEDYEDERIINTSDNDELAIIKSTLLDVHNKIFAVIFWYILLGVLGALLYRMVDDLSKTYKFTLGNVNEEAQDLLKILEWPSSRLFALGLALAGNLVSASEGIRKHDIFSFEKNNLLLSNIAISALEYSSESDISNENDYFWINQFKLLVLRTLVIWIAIIGIIIFAGLN